MLAEKRETTRHTEPRTTLFLPPPPPLKDENGRDPITGESLSKEDLIEVKASEC